MTKLIVDGREIDVKTAYKLLRGCPMGKRPDNVVRRLPEDFLEALRRFFQELEDAVSQQRKRFDPNEPDHHRPATALTTAILVLVAASLASAVLLKAWLVLGSP